MGEPLLAVQDLRTHFATPDGIVRAVDGIDFAMAPGETVGVVGESGSGKSVLSLSIMRLIDRPGYHPSGKIRFEGADLMALRPRAMEDLRGNRMAMIFQDPMTSLNPFLTVGRQLTEVLERHRGLRPAAAHASAAEMLAQVGLSDVDRRLAQHPHQFSGGMRQRVMIAMALLCSPSLIIADEPTTALDVTIAAQILALVRALQKRTHTSLLLITHDLGVVAGMADRVMVMYAGRVVEQARVDDLFARPRHPYTVGLMACIPRIAGPKPSQLTPIAGAPPDLSALPPGCPFFPRCPRGTDVCAQAFPPVTTDENGHQAACYHPIESGAGGAGG